MTRPVLYLSNLVSKRSDGDHHGPGRLFVGMVRPRRFEQVASRGRVPLLTPPGPAFEALRGTMMLDDDLRTYRRAVESVVTSDIQALAPGNLRGVPHGHDHGIGLHSTVEDGDTVICGCPRWSPGRPRKHPCHLDLVAPWLTFAGWDVVLWGRRLTAKELPSDKAPNGVKLAPGQTLMYPGWVDEPVYAGKVQRSLPAGYAAEDLGWPSLTEAPDAP